MTTTAKTNEELLKEFDKKFKIGVIILFIGIIINFFSSLIGISIAIIGFILLVLAVKIKIDLQKKGYLV